MIAFEFTEQMNEISGYGGAYERACRAAVCSGARWFAHHMTAHPQFGRWTMAHGLVNPINMDAHALLAAIEDTDFIRDDGVHVPLAEQMTREMTQIALYHVLYIAKKGWNAYVQKMSAPVAVFDEGESLAQPLPLQHPRRH
jgi:hypothetical protein